MHCLLLEASRNPEQVRALPLLPYSWRLQGHSLVQSVAACNLWAPGGWGPSLLIPLALEGLGSWYLLGTQYLC